MPMGEYVPVSAGGTVSNINTIYDDVDTPLEIDEKLRKEYEAKRRSQRKRRGLLSIFTGK